MRPFFLICAIMCCATAFCQEDYVIRINDTAMSIALDKPYQMMVNGRKVNFSIAAKDTLTYRDELYSFTYPKEIKVSDVSPDKNVNQIMAMNALGSGFLIQSYKAFNPEPLTELLVDQATKQNTNSGYSLERSEYQRTIRSGQTLKVIRLVQRYKDNVKTYEVAIYGMKDSGVALVTFNMPGNPAAPAKDIVAMMWQSLSIK
jgi:hypothetical protein